MRFVVPQFIEVEDKIIGPFSVRQFLIFLAGLGMCFVCYKIFSFVIFIVLAVMIFGSCGVFAFANINGQMFHYFILNLITTFKRPNLKVWRREVTAEDIKRSRKKSMKTSHLIQPVKKEITRSKLTELTLVVDTGGAYKEEGEGAVKIKTN